MLHSMGCQAPAPPTKPHRGHRDFEKVNKLYCVYSAGDRDIAPMGVVKAVFRMDEYSVRRVIKETRSGCESRVQFNGCPDALGLASIVIVEA